MTNEHTALRSGLVVTIILCGIAIAFTRRPGPATALALIGGLAAIVLITDIVLTARRARAVRRRRATPWAKFQEPAQLNGRAMWRCGIRRKTDDGEVLDTDEENDELIEMDDYIGRIEAEGRAEMRARDYNEQKVRM